MTCSLYKLTVASIPILFHSLRTLGCGLLAYFAWQHPPQRHICVWSRLTTRGSSSKVRGRPMLQLFVHDMRALLNLVGFDIPIKSSHRPLLCSHSSSLTKYGTILMSAARACIVLECRGGQRYKREFSIHTNKQFNIESSQHYFQATRLGSITRLSLQNSV